MNYFFKFLVLSFGIVFFGTTYTYAAHVYMQAPTHASSNRSPLTVLVLLDPEKDTLSGISGTFSFPADLFDVGSISIQSSVVSVWSEQPHVTDEKYFDARTHVSFEGIMPGGFDGVRSPYYQGASSGQIFSITLIPKNTGVGSFVIDELELHAYDSVATLVPSESVVSTITVPVLTGTIPQKPSILTYVKSPTLTTVVTQSDLINNGAWYLAVNEREPYTSIETMYVAESDESNPELIPSSSWRKASPVYTLLYQMRTKYIHTKIVYNNNTYTFQTIQPVDNATASSYLSRILIGVLFSLLLLRYYGKTILHFFSKTIQARA